jgi:hypothetical protein
VSDFRIIPCAEWGAAPARGAIVSAGRPKRIIFHHTAGHHAELDHKSGETYTEAVGYAKAVQQSHFSRGWLDTGNNFLVTRSGHVFEGRHGSLAAINAGKMVVSAHCPGQNDQPGIEHEQIGSEAMTPIQRQASVWLHAYICRKTGIAPSAIHGHREFFATDCPGELFADLAAVRKDVAAELASHKSPQYVVSVIDEDGVTQTAKTLAPGDWLTKFAKAPHTIVHAEVDRVAT